MKRLGLWHGRTATRAGIIACILLACSSTNESPLFYGSGVGGKDGGTGDAKTGVGGNIPVAGSGGVFNLDASTQADVPAEACATSSATATLLPTWLQFLVDISGSMNCTPTDPPTAGCPNGNPGSKWILTRNALLSAIDSLPASTGAGVVLFPYVKGLETKCFSNQAAVQLALLDPAHKQLVQKTLNAVSPVGATPTEDAYLFAVQSLSSIPDPANKFIVLITDGMPTVSKNCQGDGQSPVPTGPLITAAADAMTAGIRTFVIGSPGSQTLRTDLSKMASAGGTALDNCSDTGPDYCHLDMTTKPDFGQAITEALAAIASKTISCVFEVPDPGDGGKLDPDKVNVIFTAGGGSPDYLLQNDDPACAEGWHYSEDGKQILLCDQTCKSIQADPQGRIDIEFGCKTKQTQPH